MPIYSHHRVQDHPLPRRDSCPVTVPHHDNLTVNPPLNKNGGRCQKHSGINIAVILAGVVGF